LPFLYWRWCAAVIYEQSRPFWCKSSLSLYDALSASSCRFTSCYYNKATFEGVCARMIRQLFDVKLA
jgi:hypothetical protein